MSWINMEELGKAVLRERARGIRQWWRSIPRPELVVIWVAAVAVFVWIMAIALGVA